MICQSTYDSLEAIPEALREEFESVDGKWQLKESAVPGVGKLFNAALHKNEQKAVEQVKARNARIQALESQLEDLKTSNAALAVPGSKILSEEEAKQWEEYTKIGTPKDLQKVSEENDLLKDKTRKFELKASLESIGKATGLNSDVLLEWAQSEKGAGLEFDVKTVEVTENGKTSESKVAVVKVEKKDGSKVTVEERELLEYAKDALSDWMYSALSAEAKPSDDKPKGVVLPQLSSAKVSRVQSEAGERPIDIFNAQRSAAPNPFQAKTAKTGE